MTNKIPVVLRSGAPSKIGEMEVGDTIGINHGGTGAVSAAAARANLGVSAASDLATHTGDSNNPHSVTAAQIGAATTTDLSDHTGLSNNPHSVTAAQTGADTSAQVTAKVDAHANLANNPHSVTAAQVGSPTTAAFSTHTGDTNNPHSVTAAQTGAISATEKGVASGVATLDGAGKIPAAQIPAVALPSVSIVADATARTALIVQEGDEAKQLDDGSHWVYGSDSAWHLYPTGSGGSGSSLYFCELTSTTTIDLNDATGLSMQWDTQDIVDATHFTHSPVTNNHQVTIVENGLYRVKYKHNGFRSGSNRKNIKGVVLKNGAEIIKTRAYDYGARNASNPYTTILSDELVPLLAGDVLEAFSQQAGDVGIVNSLAGECSFSITQVRKL